MLNQHFEELAVGEWVGTSNKFSYLIDCVGYLPSPFGGSLMNFMVMDCIGKKVYTVI